MELGNTHKTFNQARAIVRTVITFAVLTLVSVGNAQASTTLRERVDFTRAMPEENVEDMRVKVLGGAISVNRFYRVMKRYPDLNGYPGVSGALEGYAGNTLLANASIVGDESDRYDFGVWQFHRRWHDLIFIKGGGGATSSGGSGGGNSAGFSSDPDSDGLASINTPKYIDRNDYLYARKSGENYYVYENNGNDLRITRTDTGYRWSNREGDWIDYNEDGMALKSGDKNGVSITLVRNNGFITQYKDHNGHVVVSWEYQGDRLSKVTDYGGRSVTYNWQGDFLVSVITTRGHEWKYGYENFGQNRVMTSKTDPENQTFKYEFGLSKGGFQTRRGASNPEFTTLGDDTPVGSSSGSSGGSNRAAAPHSVPVEPMLMHTGKIYPDGKRIQYQYLYDPESKSYMILRVNSDGVEQETWFDLDGRIRYNLISGRVAGVRIRNGNVAVARDPYGQRTTTKYTRHEAVESVTFADGASVSFKYLPNYNFPTLKTDQIGVQTKYEYDFSGNLLRTIYASNHDDSRVVEYDYDAFGQVIAMRYLGNSEAETAQTAYLYDAYGNLIKITDARGNVTEFKDYNASGQAQTSIDGRGNEWKTVYDAAGNPTTATTALGFVSTNEYDTLHRLTKTTDAESRATEFDYDSRNFNLNVIDNDGGERRTTRRMDGLVTTVKDESGQVTTYQYDRVARLTSVVDGVGNTTTIVYDKQQEVAGRTINSIITPNRTSHFVYDRLYRLTEQTDVSTLDDDITRTSRYGYNGRGERTAFTDANGHVTHWQYTPHGEYKTVVNAAAEIITNQYDSRGNLTHVIDPLEKIYQFSYDLNDNLASETRPMGQQQRFNYNQNDNQSSFIDYNGHLARYEYDDDNRLIEQTNTKLGATTPERIATHTFDKSGLMVSSTDQNTATTYEYDAVGRLAQQNTTFFTGGLPFTKVLKNGYYKNGQIKTRTDAEGAVTTFAYDGAGKFKLMAIQGAGSIIANAYDGNLVSALTYPGGITRRYTYDGFARPESIVARDNAGNPQMDLRYQRDLVGNILEKTTQEGTYQYGYDAVYRLTSSEQPNAFGDNSYAYDKVGNRISQTTADKSLVYQYNDSHELTSIEQTVNSVVSSQAYSYDNNGAQTIGATNIGEPSFDFTHNAYGRLSTVSQDGNTIAHYNYDISGRRSSKLVDGGADESEVYFLYDETGVGLVGEYTQAGELIRGYTYKSSSNYTTDPVTQKVKTESGYDISFYQNDYLGTPQLMLGSNGAVHWKASFDAFGSATESVQSRSNPLRFPGQYFDVETGASQNWNRYYNSNTGRYMTSDPIGLDGGINTYAYAYANPIRFYDPYGLWSWGDPLPQGLVDGATGFGDTVSLGATSWVRDEAGIHGGVNKCSSAYSNGEWVAIVYGFAAGGAVGLRAAGKKGIGREFSHWIPGRARNWPGFNSRIGRWILQRGNRANGNYVTPTRHFRHDNFRYPGGWRDLGPRFPRWLQQFDRVPHIFKGSGVGGAAAGASANGEDCECG